MLATTGPYALVRNPLYTGSLLLITGLGMAAKLGWLLPGTIGWAFIVFAIACKHEERRLLAKYGEVYEAYRAQVPAWWPRSLPESPVRIEQRGFGVVLAVQVLQAFVCLAAFALIEIYPLRLWHQA
jgi:hypothetical protein